jgi:hypothetical protein
MGVLAYFCSQHPGALLQIAFIPGFTFTADSVSIVNINLDALRKIYN